MDGIGRVASGTKTESEAWARAEVRIQCLTARRAEIHEILLATQSTEFTEK